MKLTPQQSRWLHEALLDAYSESSLTQMVLFRLGEKLDEIVESGSLSEVVFDLILWADRVGKLEDLINEAHAFNPQNQHLKSFVQELSNSYEAEDVLTNVVLPEPWTKSALGYKKRLLPLSAVGLILVLVILGWWYWPPSTVAPSVTLSASREPAVVLERPPIQVNEPDVNSDHLRVGLAEFADCNSSDLLLALIAEFEKSRSLMSRVQLERVHQISDSNEAHRENQFHLVIWGKCSTDLMVRYEIVRRISPGKVFQPMTIEVTTSAIALDRADRVGRAIMHYLLAELEAAEQSFSLLANDAANVHERELFSYLQATSMLLQKRYEEAAQIFQRLAEGETLQAESYLNLGIAQFNRAFELTVIDNTREGHEKVLMQNANAQQSFTNAIAIAEQSKVDALVFALVNRSATRYLMPSESLDQALADCQRAIDLFQAPIGYLCRANVYATMLYEARLDSCNNHQLVLDARADLLAIEDDSLFDVWSTFGWLSEMQLECNRSGPDAEKHRLDMRQHYQTYVEHALDDPYPLAVDEFYLKSALKSLGSVSP